MKVSILIPLFNAEKYIAETLECAIRQTWKDKEIIVVDDGSTDNSYNIARTYESDILKTFRQENKGASAARNKAFSMSTGDLIQYLDSDDLLSPNKIEQQANLYLNNSDQDSIVTCNLLYFRDNIVTGLEFPRSYAIMTDYSPGELLLDILDYPLGTQTSMWLTPRNLIEKAGPWNEEISFNDDGEFFFRVISKSLKVCYCANAVVYYRMPFSGLSCQRSGHASDSLMMSMNRIREIIFSYSDNYRTRIAYAKALYRFYAEFNDGGRYNKFVESEIRSLGLTFSILKNPYRRRFLYSQYSTILRNVRRFGNRKSNFGIRV